MNFTLESVVIATLGGIVFLLAAYLVFETWLRAWEQRVPSPLARTLYRAGVDLRRLASPTIAREVALMEQRCPTCPAIGSCREWLESGSLTSYRSFCPNAVLVEQLTAPPAR
jgi:uncharacterized protein DUF6455